MLATAAILCVAASGPLDAQPTDRATATEQGVALFKQGRYAEAKQRLADALAADPKDAAAHAYLGMAIYNFDNDVDKAMAQMEEAAKLDPPRSLYHQWLGVIYGGKAGSSSLFKAAYYAMKCKDEFAKGVELDPKDPGARENLLQFYLVAPAIAGGSVAKAKEQASALLELDACRGLVAQAAIARREKDLRKAEMLYREAIKAAPSRSLPYNALGYFLLGQKRTDEAVELFRTNVRAVPDDPNAYDSLGEGLLAQGHAEESLAEYARALQIDPYFASAYLGSARCHERKNELAQAREAYQRYLELAPKGRSADDARKKLQELQKKNTARKLECQSMQLPLTEARL